MDFSDLILQSLIFVISIFIFIISLYFAIRLSKRITQKVERTAIDEYSNYSGKRFEEFILELEQRQNFADAETQVIKKLLKDSTIIDKVEPDNRKKIYSQFTEIENLLEAAKKDLSAAEHLTDQDLEKIKTNRDLEVYIRNTNTILTRVSKTLTKYDEINETLSDIKNTLLEKKEGT